MFADDYDFDYDRMVEDMDELYADDFYDDEEDNHTDEREYEHYYHNVMDELDSEQPSLRMDATWWDKYLFIPFFLSTFESYRPFFAIL